jgi:hypothetical protein
VKFDRLTRSVKDLGDPPVPIMETLMSEPFEQPIHLRLPRDVHERAAALVEGLAEDPELRAFGRMSKTAVLRLAVLHGLDVLEQRALRTPRAKANAPRRLPWDAGEPTLWSSVNS